MIFKIVFFTIFIILPAHANIKKSSKILKDPLKLAVLKKNQKKLIFYKQFPKIYNPEIKKWIYFFVRKKSYARTWLKRSYRYFPGMESVLHSYQLPTELVAMTLIESSLSARAKSRAQAVGYWQFMLATAHRFDLRVNFWLDERQDFYKSTVAAAKYLTILYAEFSDWLLVMAAYNMGEARLKKLITKYKSTDFWFLYKKSDFPKETASYIPKVLAASKIVQHPERYGLKEFQILLPYNYDIFYVSGGMNLKTLSLKSKIPFSKIRELNPDIKSHIIPKSISSHSLRVPKGSGILISKWLDKKNKSY